MPAALAVDKELAKELYINGMPITEVAKRLGVKMMTVGAWKSRGRWDEVRLRCDTSEPIAVQEAAKALNNQAYTLSKRILCKAEGLDMDCPRDAKDVAAAVSAAYAIGRRSLNMDDTTTQHHLHVHMMTEGAKALAAGAAVIDVPSEVSAPEMAPAVEQPPDPASDVPSAPSGLRPAVGS